MIKLLFLLFSSMAFAANPTTQYSPFIFKASCVAGSFNLPNQTCLQQGTFALTESGGAATVDWSKGALLYTLTLNSNLTLSFTNPSPGQTIVIRLTNTASNYTVTWPTIKWPVQTTPVMTTGAFSDVYTIIYDGSTYYGSYIQNY